MPVDLRLVTACLTLVSVATSVPAAPLVLYDTTAATVVPGTAPSAPPAYAAPASACGGFGAPCGFLTTPPGDAPPVHTFTVAGQKFEWGGSVSTGVGFANHGGTAVGGDISAWVKSPDSSFEALVSIDEETLRNLQGLSGKGNFGVQRK